MKIAFDYKISNDQTYGGVSRYYKNLSSKLLKLERGVHVFAGIHLNHHISLLAKEVVR